VCVCVCRLYVSVICYTRVRASAAAAASVASALLIPTAALPLARKPVDSVCVAIHGTAGRSDYTQSSYIYYTYGGRVSPRT